MKSDKYSLLKKIPESISSIDKIYTKQVTYRYNITSKKRVSETVTVLIYEDQPEPLNEESASLLFAQYPQIKEIHELHEKWGGRWTRTITTRAHKSS